MIEVMRVDKMHRSLLESMLTDGGYSPHKKKNMPRMGGAVLRQRSKRLLRTLWGGPTVELIEMVLWDSARHFNVLDRYQRRALSRLKRAIEDFDTVRILEAIKARGASDPATGSNLAHTKERPFLL